MDVTRSIDRNRHAITFEADRPNRNVMDRNKAVAFMIDEKGQMFDPAIVDVFIGLHEEVF
ncbi:MAG: hypothetical protein MUD12_00685 [Spirochaetes bacterium]|jgi:HD-GYP domain-containing protein (c-di-GMP phosphodiesterase class II)|nr:hypothetical protein [Spirochaetota bacterium]